MCKVLAAVPPPGGVIVSCDPVEAWPDSDLDFRQRHWDDGVRERILKRGHNPSGPTCGARFRLAAANVGANILAG